MCTIILVGSLGWISAEEIPEIERRIPPAGIELGAEEREVLEAGVRELEAALVGREEEAGFADVGIYAKALRFALTNGEFFKEKRDVGVAEAVLAEGRKRVEPLHGPDVPRVTVQREPDGHTSVTYPVPAFAAATSQGHETVAFEYTVEASQDLVDFLPVAVTHLATVPAATGDYQVVTMRLTPLPSQGRHYVRIVVQAR